MLIDEYISGQSVKGYDLLERIGAGAFGAVYRAYQSTVGREVAVKVILPGFANHPDFIRRFEMEAQLVARLEHIHIVPLYDYWRDPNGAYLVMRWLRGGSLKEAIQANPYDVTSAVKLMDQISSGLAAAHRKDIIHRDIKPSNILLDEEGNAYLSDFGIARDLGQPAGSAEDGKAITGSPTYLSPEQVRRELVSFQSDIYNLGVLLYELLTGQHPFPATNPVETMFKHLNNPLPWVDSLDPDIQEQVNGVIQKATAKNPRHRYKDVLEMAAAFRQVAQVGQSLADSNLADSLTGREQEILGLIVSGRSNKQIAQDLYVELTTVKWYITQIYRKLNVRSRMQAIVRARALSLIFPGKEDGIGPSEQSNIQIPTLILTNPYKGLRAFEAADSRDFFGREDLTARLVERMGENFTNRSRFLAIIGPSGCGKSSLVKAGLIPALRRGELAGSERWYVVEMTPGEQPLDGLEVALSRVAANQGENIRLHLERDPNGLVRAANLILPQDGSQLLLVIDQFEEVFTLIGEEQRRHFLDLITAAATAPNSRVRIVVTLRADFYDRPLQYPEFGELVHRCMETVLPLTAEELERVILRPAEQVGVRFEPGLVSTIIEDIHYQPGALPLLQYALTELFDYRQDRTLTHQAYRQIGGSTGALARRAEEIYRQQSQEGEESTRQLFLRLVALEEPESPSGSPQETQRRALRTEILSLAIDPELMDVVIDTFAAYRLLSLDYEPATRKPTVQLAHEAILREWERLRIWLDQSREDLIQERRLNALTQEWLATGMDAGYLLPEARLDQFSSWAATTSLKLTPDEAAFLQASQAAKQNHFAEEEARRQRELETARKLAETERQRAEDQARAASRLRRRAVYLTIALLAALGLAAATYLFLRQAELQRRLAFTRELAAASISNLDRDPELSLLLALQAAEQTYRRAGNVLREVEEALHRSLQAHRLLLTIPHGGSLALSPDGKQIATGGKDGMIHIWDAAKGTSIQGFAAHTGMISALAFSPDGQRLLSGGLDAKIRLWDSRSGQQLLSISSPEGAVYSVAYTPDGKRLVVGTMQSIFIWDAVTGEQISQFLEKNLCGAVRDIVLTQDGKWIGASLSEGCNFILDSQTGATERHDRVLARRFPDAYGVAFSPSGGRLALALARGDAKVRNVHTESGAVFFFGHFGDIYDLEFSPDGGYLATASADGTARYWDSSTGEQLAVLSGHRRAVNQLRFFPDGQRLATSSEDGTTRVWDVSPGGSREWLTMSNSPRTAEFVTYSPDGQYIAACDAYSVGIYDAKTGSQLSSLEFGDKYLAPPADFILQSDLLASNYNFVTPGVFDVKTGKLVTKYKGHASEVSAVAFSPDGSQLASGDVGGVIKIWDTSDGGELKSLEVHTGKILDLEFSPDGVQLASSSKDGRVILWESASLRPLFTLIEDQPAVESLAFSPNGHRLVTSGADGNARIWDTTSGQLLLTLQGHTGGITGVDYSPDSLKIATASIDSTARLWDAASGDELLILGGHTSGLTGVSFHPDGKRLATSSLDGTVRVYALDIQDLLSLARGRLTRSLTVEECQQYLHMRACPAE